MIETISVVMAAHNGASQLRATMDSVLAQQGVDFEFVVVDDGSTDETLVILEEYAARDNRVRVMRSTKVGLTRALIAGCDAARGGLIARQDCGDRSLPGRLLRQAKIFASDPEAVLAAVGARFVGPSNEALYEIKQGSSELRRGLSLESGDELHGPAHHGATMFRKSAYNSVGGYRAAFEVAQDLDLWTRLVERGRVSAIPEVLYEATLSIGAVSHLRRKDQMRANAVIETCVLARRRGENDAAIIADWRDAQQHLRAQRREDHEIAALYYFFGGVTRRSNARAARAYYRQALRHSPLAPKIWFRFGQVSLASIFSPARCQDRAGAPR